MINARMKINAKEVYHKGIFGEGIVVAVIDSGIDMHSDLLPRIRLHKNFSGSSNGISDEFGHGTHVAGIIAGNGKLSNGKYMGIAPAAELISIKVLDQEGKGESFDTIRALDWIIENNKKEEIKIINFSMGFLENASNGNERKIIDKIEQLWCMGVVVVAAAGNNGPVPGTITVPGISRKIITVGCLEEEVNSGKGPTIDGIIKPEIVAPGKNIVSLSSKGGYSRKTGSSMATPMVSGAIALLLNQSPKLKPWDVKNLLYKSCKRNQGDGWGVLDVDNLIKIL